MKLSALAVVLVALGIALGLALRGTVFEAEAAKPPTPTPSATPTPSPTPGPQAVEEQNVDANGYIAVHEQGVADVNVVSMPSGSGGVCYTNWNADTCAAGYTAVSTGEWTAIQMFGYTAGYSLICAAPKTDNTYSLNLRSVTVSDGGGHALSHEPCAVCCK